jgi:tRNA dimethylallyltransferase
MRCVGYRQMWMYLEGNLTRPEMVNRSVVATRQLAKRQLTWLRKYQNVLRLDYQGYSFDDVCHYLSLK